MDGGVQLRRSLFAFGISAIFTGLAVTACGLTPEEQEAVARGSPLAVACPADPRTGQITACDGGTDAGPDGGPRDGGHDGGPTDGGPDGGPRDGGPDGGPRDGGPDGGPDGGHDGGVDAGPDGGICEAHAANGFQADEGAPIDACKWPAPTHIEGVNPTNFILDIGILNIVGKFQDKITHDTDICKDDRASSGTGYIQGCLRATAAPVGQCLSGSGKISEEHGSCNTPDCACEGANGTCKAPGCSMDKTDYTFGGGGGWNVKGGKNIPIIGALMPTGVKNPLRVNFNLIGQFGGGKSDDDRNGSSPCFNCCANGNPLSTDTLHGNAEVKMTGFLTLRFWKFCATLTVSGAVCAQVDRVTESRCNGTRNTDYKSRVLMTANWGNFYLGYCPGTEDDDKRNFRGGVCTYDPTRSTYRCGIGWFNREFQWLPSTSWDVFGNGATQDICLF